MQLKEAVRSPKSLVEQLIQRVKEQYGITVVFAKDIAMTQRYAMSYIDSILQSGNRDWYEILKYDKRLERSYVDALWRSLQNMHLQTIEEEKNYVQKKMREVSEVQQGDVTTEERKICLRSLLEELATYPEHFVQLIAHNELRIVFSENEETTIIGLSSGVADDARIDIDVQLQYPHDGDTKAFDVSVLHHEIMHRIDRVLSDNSGADYGTEISDWRASHSEGGGSYYRDEWISKASEFINYDTHKVVGTKGLYIPKEYRGGMPYAQESPFEDRARIMQGLMTEYSYLMKQVSNDSLLAEKVAIIKMTLEHLSDGVMDDEYWNIMATGDRDAVRAYVRKREREKEED